VTPGLEGLHYLETRLKHELVVVTVICSFGFLSLAGHTLFHPWALLAGGAAAAAVPT
jgi:hypothetical protein